MSTGAAGMLDLGATAERELRIGPHELAARLHVPAKVRGVVVIVLGSEPDWTPLDAIEQEVRGKRLATLVVHLLAPGERIDDAPTPGGIGLLSERTGETLDWLRAQAVEGHSSIGLCAIASAAAGALRAAGERPAGVAALVSVCGRTDLAADRIALVQAATLLVVGSEDAEMLRLNRQSFSGLHCLRRLEIIPRVRHADEDPATRSTVAHLAAAWLAHHLGRMQAV